MTSSPRTGGRLIAAAVVLATAGTMLLYAGARTGSPRPATGASAPRAAAAAQAISPQSAMTSASPQASVTPVLPAAPAASPSRSGPDGLAARPSNTPGELPPPGSGPEADPLIQRALDRASRPDLPPDDERALLEAGRAAWMTETAGYTQVRIQAAIARRDTSLEATGSQVRAVVRLVWAGGDPAGTHLDGRPAILFYTQDGNGSWKRT